MVLIVTLQIDWNYNYRFCKSFNINPKSSSKVKRCKAPALYWGNSVKCFNLIINGDIDKNLGSGSHPVLTICSNSKISILYRLF